MQKTPSVRVLLAMLIASGACSSDQTSTLTCGVVRTPLAALGDSAGPGIIADETSVVRGSGGNFYVYRPYGHQIKIYDAAGRYVQTVGSHGEGPGEIAEIASIQVDDGGGLHVFDYGNAKVLRFSSDATFLDEVRLDVTPTRRTLLRDSTYLLVGPVYTEERLGYPVHQVSWEGEARSSFGTDDPQYRPDVPYMSDRVVAPASDGDIWLAFRDRYVIEKWSRTGVRVRRLEPARDWLDAERNQQLRDDGGPQTVTTGIFEDATGHVWLSAVVPDPEWRSVVRSSPVEEHDEVSDITKYYDVQVDVLDASDGTLVAELRSDSLFGFVGAATAASEPRITDGVPRIPTWSLDLRCDSSTG